MKRSIFFVMICMLLLSLTASAQQPLPPPMAPEQVNELMAQARAQGTVRVIVEFAVPAMTRSMSERERGDAIKIARLGLLSNVRSGQAQLVANSETWTIPFAALEVDAAALQALAATPGVLRISPDTVEYRHLESALPLIDIDDAHARGTGTGYGGLTGEGWTVVVLDDGIQANHAFFGGRIVHEACFSVNGTHPNGTYTSMCPSGAPAALGLGTADTNSRCNNMCDHGTHVMGIAIGDDGASRKGVAPDANGIMINVFAYDDWTVGTVNDGPVTFASTQIAGLEYVKNTLRYEYKIASINMSLGGGKFFDACDVGANAVEQARVVAINELTAIGIAVVISSGNNSYKDAVTRPGCISSAITVSAVEDNVLNVASFSNVNEMVDFFAPGANITSSVPVVNGNYAAKQGTSMAAPFVAGAWAVIKQAAPNASVGEIESALTVTGIPIDDNRGGGIEQNIPLIQVDAAIDLLRPAEDMVFNGGMEAVGEPGVPDGWIRVGASKRVCNNPDKTHTIFGNCAAKMMAAVGTVSQIKQTLELPRGIYDDQIEISAQVKAKSLINGQLILKVTYASGSIVTKKIVLHKLEGQPAPSYGWTLRETSPLVLNDTVTNLVVIAKVKPGGKYFIDDIAVDLNTVPVDND
jgi:subtilisin family serine protease